MDEEDVLRERLKLLGEYTSDLREVQGLSFQEYQEKKWIRKGVERTLQTAIETCLDIGNHIIATEGFRFPEDNKDVFVILGEEGVVPADLFPRLIDMARFRNLLVHEYAKIDDAIVYVILRKRLGDFDRFAKAIVTYLERPRRSS